MKLLLTHVFMLSIVFFNFDCGSDPSDPVEENVWQKTNFEFQGKISSFTSNSSGHLYVGTIVGIYHSKDRGENWSLADWGLKEGEVTALTVTDGGVLFAGLSDASESLYRSEDDGKNWATVTLDANKIFDRDPIRPVIPLRVNVVDLMWNSAGHLFLLSESLLLHSVDDAENWQLLTEGLPTLHEYSSKTELLAVAIGPEDNMVISVKTFTGPPMVLQSLDNGNTWERINDGLPPYSYAVTDIAINSKQHIFVSSNTFIGGVFRSIDGGNSWENIGFTDEMTDIAVGPLDDLYVMTSESKVYMSDDNGDNWVEWHERLGNIKGHIISASPDGFVYVIEENGNIYRRRTMASNDGTNPVH
jgi:photosystem II stability/assembly factor-like uncharacterized protein